ncbi:hypothetical protein P245_03480 [Comamonas thiooxydans]|uniref:Uncharacterized protein n=1 Tax=Comamonas thiooxydans TaxID=363952 RepID=A0A0E3BJ77_9BURK|nr:hypothetical protein P245_03480 [Comamonas thiooxydans]
MLKESRAVSATLYCFQLVVRSWGLMDWLMQQDYNLPCVDFCNSTYLTLKSISQIILQYQFQIF